jgi:hypothetical protein
MNINLMPFVIVGVLLLLAVIAMIVWRKVISSREDDTIHVLEDSAMVPSQVAVAQKLEVIDKWGKLLTIVAIVYVVAVGALYLYQVWMRASTTVSM